MIRGVHTMFYSNQADELRSFIKDKLGLSYTDVGEGWLIFDVPEAEVGCHPTEHDPQTGTHSISFYCDDIQKTVAQLQSRGVQFTTGIDDRGYGLVTGFTMPGGVHVELYQPRYRKNPAPKPPAAKKASAKKRVAKKTTAKRRAASRKRR